MTNALYRRIEAIESFAADVAHELKNPLTSLRSAVETLPLAKTAESQARLLAVIQHDVKRLDRLISDISDASRLDAELQRNDAGAGRSRASCSTPWSAVRNEVRQADDATVSLTFEGGGPLAFVVPGHDSRLGQVFDNLIDNARSFSPPGGTVRVTCRRLRNEVEIVVDDDGPGIRPDAFEQHLRALLHRPAAPGLRPEFRARPFDLQADRRSARRTHLGGEPHRRRRPRRTSRRTCSARASWCACRRCDDGADHPRLRRAGRRARRADPRAVGLRQVAAGARAAARRRRPARCRSRGWSATTASMSRPHTAVCWCGRRRRSPG